MREYAVLAILVASTCLTVPAYGDQYADANRDVVKRAAEWRATYDAGQSADHIDFVYAALVVAGTLGAAAVGAVVLARHSPSGK